MLDRRSFSILAACTACSGAGALIAAQPAPFATRQLADNVHVFRYAGHQSIASSNSHVRRNHSDNSLVLLLPRQRILFTVDFIPIETLHWRDMPDSFLPDWFDSLARVLAMAWDSMAPGHPYAGGRLGTKDDVRNLKQYMTDMMAAVRAAEAQGKCFDTAMREIKLPRYERGGSYEAFLPGNIERFCEWPGRGF